MRLSTAPVLTPISIEDAKLERRIDDDADDVGIDRRIRGATSRVESFLGRGLLTQSWTYCQDVFASTIPLPMAAPLQSVTSVKYYDVDGTQQTLSASVYGVDTESEPGRVYLKSGQSWPSVQSGRPLAVEVIYVVGWTSADLIEPAIVEGVYLTIGTRDEFREDVSANHPLYKLPSGAESWLYPHRRFWHPPESCA
jgi:uncharacterized phiE125 gp8 family phage protein